MHEYAKRQKVLEINPRSPLIEGLLRRVEQLPEGDEERDLEAEAELEEVATILIDSALVRSGFDVPDSDEYVIFVLVVFSGRFINMSQILCPSRSCPPTFFRCIGDGKS